MKPVRKCDECGHQKTDVDLVADPFALEINDQVWMRWLCGGCLQDRTDEV